MFNIVIAELRHETNTFSTIKTDLNAFKNRNYVYGDRLISAYRGIKAELGGFIDVLEKQEDVNIIPAIGANAMPSGKVTQDAIDNICSHMLNALNGPAKVDGVLISLHGAMVTENSDDGEGDFLELVRNAVGADVPIMATLDLHATVTDKKLKNADVLIAYDKYPHSDMYDRAVELAECMLGTLRGELRPVMYSRRLPLVLPMLCTDFGEMAQLVGLSHDIEKDPCVISASFCHGFFAADVHDSGVSTIVVTNNDAKKAEEYAGVLADAIWERRSLLKRDDMTPEDAVAEAKAFSDGLVILADVNDNPGSGSGCDGTHLLRAMLDAGCDNAAIAHIYDPESVRRAMSAGVGNTVHLHLGGKTYPDLLGEPVECDAYVKLISDGKYVNKGPMSGGMTVDLKGSAVVNINGIDVIISSNITQAHDVNIFYAHGIDITQKKMIAVKSAVHFRASFGEYAKRIIDVECRGLIPLSPQNVDYQKLRRPIYPLDTI
ncbi:MAG: M81 family metallopeptidase [Clostridia bacterium]|nr:M81 family metallopeptidase [Clostridia bacterium]